jgi:hypothetical protein
MSQCERGMPKVPRLERVHWRNDLGMFPIHLLADKLILRCLLNSLNLLVNTPNLICLVRR